MNSRAKGAKNERGLTKLFEEWTGYEFQRSPASGGLRWNMKSNTVGDIICTDEKHTRRFPFVIEAKFYSDIKFEHSLLPVKNNKIEEFWNQALDESQRAGRIPLLFMRYNNMPKNYHFVGLDLTYHNEVLKMKPDWKYVIMPHLSLILMPSTQFFEIPYKVIYKPSKKFIKKWLIKQSGA